MFLVDDQSTSHVLFRMKLRSLMYHTRLRSLTWRYTVKRLKICSVLKGKGALSLSNLVRLILPLIRGKSSLKVREHKILGPYVENLSKLAVRSFKVGMMSLMLS